MLIVVEDRDVALFFELLLDFKAAGSSDILEIDAAERTADQRNGIDDLVNVLASHTERERVHVAKRLEERALTLHNRHTCLGTDVAQTEHGGAVRNNGDKIAASCQHKALVIVLLNFQARLRDTGGVGESEFLGI